MKNSLKTFKRRSVRVLTSDVFVDSNVFIRIFNAEEGTKAQSEILCDLLKWSEFLKFRA